MVNLYSNSVGTIFIVMEHFLALLPVGQHEYARSILRGIRSAVRDTGQFRVFLMDLFYRPVEELELVIAKKDIHGIVAFAARETIESAVLNTGLPAVNVSGNLRKNALPTVCVDNHAVGRQAAEHLLSRGLSSFAYVGRDTGFSDLRKQGFTQRLQASDAQADDVSSKDLQVVVRRIRQMEPPVGVFCVFDSLARELLEELLDTGWSCPDEVAILGVDNLLHHCEGGG